MSFSSKEAINRQVATVSCRNYSEQTVAVAVERIIDLSPSFAMAIKPGGIILVKPNLLSPRSPVEGVTTHPGIVEVVVKKCFEYGAKEVWLGDSCANAHDDNKLWDKTGMSVVSDRTGAVLKSFYSPLRSCTIAGSQVPIPSWLTEIDGWISVPKLKTHDLTVLTCAIKNSFGLVAGKAKSQLHARYPSPLSISRFILELYNTFPPNFIFVDAVEAMEGHGPANGKVRQVGLVMGSENGFAVDGVCAKMLREKPEQIPFLKHAMTDFPEIAETIEQAVPVGDGAEHLQKQPLLESSSGGFLQKIPEPVFQIGSLFLGRRPWIDPASCCACGSCEDICSQKAVERVKRADGKSVYKIKRSRCITCLCCAEVCPHSSVVTSLRERVKRILSGPFR